MRTILRLIKVACKTFESSPVCNNILCVQKAEENKVLMAIHKSIYLWVALWYRCLYLVELDGLGHVFAV